MAAQKPSVVFYVLAGLTVLAHLAMLFWFSIEVFCFGASGCRAAEPVSNIYWLGLILLSLYSAFLLYRLVRRGDDSDVQRYSRVTLSVPIAFLIGIYLFHIVRYFFWGASSGVDPYIAHPTWLGFALAIVALALPVLAVRTLRSAPSADA